MLSLQVSDHTGQEWLTAFQVCTDAQVHLTCMRSTKTLNLQEVYLLAWEQPGDMSCEVGKHCICSNSNQLSPKYLYGLTSLFKRFLICFIGCPGVFGHLLYLVRDGNTPLYKVTAFLQWDSA